ncbi:D-hexose-6-phosphate mutarotase [Methyloprofundus sp.]|uniref:D-hexose-6-phosphate mutarotase n=1 Tax=Methyloprofundus sp. TaxID=2020875 RepID=UPI00262A50BD|nr:D-hexose-6-phosphate mutarotase [Methyloprofundus sp.]
MSDKYNYLLIEKYNFNLKNKRNTINIQQLNADFGIAKHIEFVQGKGGLPCIQVNNTKASALISVYAGQVLSFKPVNQTEDFMFISDNAYFAEGKASKGGVPICWPWFGAAPEEQDVTALKKPDHGFVRTGLWAVLATEMLANGDSKIVLELKDTEKSRKIWPYSFHLILEILISDSLTLQLLTCNTGKQPFAITEAFHAYLNVGDARKIKVSGLENTDYLDKNAGFSRVHQQGVITLTKETDRIYTNNKHEMLLDDPTFKRQIKISSSGNKNVVVWNPWVKGVAAIKDLDNDDYKQFICLEVANAAEHSVLVLPNSESRMTANYSLA